MSKPINTGGAAFPRPYGEAKTSIEPYTATWSHSNPQSGMTMRQYYKAAIAPAVLNDLVRDTGFSPEYFSRVVGDMDDALIAEDEEWNASELAKREGEANESD